MKLWNDYEGQTIADRYVVGTLLRPEGRTALFTLASGPGAPAILRLTESINDEQQMLATWRALSALNHENLVSLTDFGETTLDSIPLTYAVLEPNDAILADVLAESTLSHDDTVQLARSLASALSALHGAGLIHQHVSAANIFAVGETVKLRADSAQPCIVDHEFLTVDDRARLIQQDIHDYAVVLLRALTLQNELRPGQRLAAPFDRILPRALDGSASLAEILTILTPAAVPAPAAAAAPAPIAQATLPYTAAAPSVVDQHPIALPPEPPAHSPAEAAAAVSPLLFQRRIQLPTAVQHSGSTRIRVWAAGAAAAILLGTVLLHHGHSATPPAANGAAASASPVATPANTPESAQPEESQADAPATALHNVQPGWYVVAYTFRHQQQALQRAEAILRRNPNLRPQVIAPSNGAYLVALGGAMSRNQAEAIRDHARRAGLPRDTFVRNYGS